MTNSDRLAVLWLDLDGKLFNLGLTLAVIGAIKREPFYFLLMALCFLISCWFGRKAVKAQLESKCREKRMDQR